jgi:DNA-binding transcriptional LysR family regulator
MVELRHLEHFVAVAEEGGFTRAAARVHVVQSGVSVSIRALERELGARLFDRTTQRVVLTDAGLALLPEAHRVLAAAEGARDAVAGVSGGLRGTLRLGIMQGLALVDLAGFLTRFHTARPAVDIRPRLAPGGSVELVGLVAAGELDIAFAALTSYPPDVSVLPLAVEPLMLACPREHHLAGARVVELASLHGEQFVDVPRGWGTRQSAEHLLEREGVQRRVVVEVPDVTTLVELVRAGLGLAFLAQSLVPIAAPICLRPITPSALFEVALVARPESLRSPAAQAFFELVSAGAG